MREFTVGAIAGLCAYGAAWWSALDAPAAHEASASAEVAPKAQRAVARTRPEPQAAQREAIASAVTAAPRNRRGVVAAPATPVAASELSVPPEALPPSLRRLAEFRREGETPAELVKRVETFELSPEELAHFRRVAAQLFEMPTNSMERQPSPWGARGPRSGELTAPR